ncbi:MAG: ribosome biogenesis GTPase Der [Gammaproteobacteria bacterium]|nr:MAG: ribosome biogenesis GTPase Der [Gammaproteobacteria bacterium]
MLPVIALAGRTNVGKSTLYNRLTGTRDALVADYPGLTRDRQYGYASIPGHEFIVVDTGGLADTENVLGDRVSLQAGAAFDEADAIVFMTDAREGLNANDETIAQQLRKLNKPVYLTVNKSEGRDLHDVVSDFYSLGIGEPVAISATRGSGVELLVHRILDDLSPALYPEPQAPLDQGISVAVIGRPNVGKSTLINRLLGEDRVLASDEPGTTRDSIYIPFEHDGTTLTLIDTAGIRRRARVSEAIEKISVIKSLQAIEAAHVVIVLLDATEGVTDQDAGLLGQVLTRGRGLVLAVNKWDGLAQSQRDNARRLLDVKLPYLDFVKTHFISALHGSGIREVLDEAKASYRAATANIATTRINRVLQDAVTRHPPPLVRGRRIKLRYAHQGGSNPPLFIVHGGQADKVPEAYRRYLANVFRKVFKLWGTPVRVEFRSTENPFSGRRNVLTPRQQRSRKRVQKFGRARR